MELPAGRGIIFVLVAFVFLIILQDLQDRNPGSKLQAKRIADAEQNALHVLSSSENNDFNPQDSKWLNITGLQENDSLPWQLLPQVRTKALLQAKKVLSSEWIETGPGTKHSIDSRRFGERYASVERMDALFQDLKTLPFYQNVTGTVRGNWLRSKLERQTVVPSERFNGSFEHTSTDDNYARNVSGTRGRLHLRLDERQSLSANIKSNTAREIKADLTIENTADETLEISLRGVHFMDSGAVLLTTVSDKFAGLYALPFLTRSEGHFKLSQHLLNNTLRRTLLGEGLDFVTDNDEQDQELYNIENEMFPMPQCEYIVYLQQHLVWPFESIPPSIKDSYLVQNNQVRSSSYLSMLENELRRPTGRSISFIPSLKFSATIFSPDCGFILESDGNKTPWKQHTAPHLEGDKMEVFLSRIKEHIVIYAALVFSQLVLLVRQIKDASTPSTQSRISYYTIAIMAMADNAAVVICWVLSAFTGGVYLPMISATFFLFLCVPFFGLKFLVDLWSIQAPEREERERQRSAARQANTNSTQNQASIPTVVITPAGADLLPLPATARRHADTGATPIILPPDQDIDAMIGEDEFQAAQPGFNGRSTNNRFNLGLKFILSSFSLTILSYIVSFWPLIIRYIYTNALIFCYLSYWIPQIHRNMIRNCRKALRWEFVFGHSVLRLVPVGYFYLYENNVLWVKTDPYMFTFFVAWQWAQILMLLSQDLLGPRFFLPAGVLPPAYDYHQILREGDEENGGFMPIGASHHSSGSSEESKEKGKWVSDCIICMHTLEVPYMQQDSANQPGSSSTAAVSNIFARRDYMITPCRHIFHSHCLNGWMRYKLQCPICRESLPPI